MIAKLWWFFDGAESQVELSRLQSFSWVESGWLLLAHLHSICSSKDLLKDLQAFAGLSLFFEW